jgi:hypothetical protein
MASLLETLNKIYGANGKRPETPTPLQTQKYNEQQKQNFFRQDQANQNLKEEKKS